MNFTENLWSVDSTYLGEDLWDIDSTYLGGIWHSIALAPDFSNFAVTTVYIDSSIFIIPICLDGCPNKKNKLFSPTTAEGVNSNIVLYADALDWDPSSTYLIYDAFNSVPTE